jgi:hypothetical protein
MKRLIVAEGKAICRLYRVIRYFFHYYIFTMNNGILDIQGFSFPSVLDSFKWKGFYLEVEMTPFLYESGTGIFFNFLAS